MLPPTDLLDSLAYLGLSHFIHDSLKVSHDSLEQMRERFSCCVWHNHDRRQKLSKTSQGM